jgi:site-specific recombinase XerD
MEGDRMFKYWEVNKELRNKENKKVINEFLLRLKDSNQCRSLVNSYRLTLQFFFKERDDLFSSLTFKSFEQWLLVYLKGRKDETVNKLLDVLRSFYSFCKEKGYIEKSPIREDGITYWELKIPLPNDKNHRVVNEFLNSLKRANRSRMTIIDYRNDLQLFFKKRKEPFPSLTTLNIKRWISEQKNHMTEKSLERYLSSFRTFYHFCIEKGYMDVNPISYKRIEEEKYWMVNIKLANKENENKINAFLLALYGANYSKRTIRSYRYNLQNFFKERKEAYSSISSDDIQKWLIQQRSKVKEGTLTYRLNTLNSFFKFCVEEGDLEKTPIKRRWFPRLPHPVPKFLNKEEVAIVNKHCETGMLRNRALVEFLLTSGCRVGEVALLNRSDVDLENRTAMVTGKGNKIRQIYFSVKCSLLIERYLEYRTDKNPALFVTHHLYPRRLSRKWMGAVISKIGLAAELQGNLHAHRFRHTFATNLMEKGADLSFIGDLLGHSNLNTTKIYANITKQKVISVYRKYMG